MRVAEIPARATEPQLVTVSGFARQKGFAMQSETREAIGARYGVVYANGEEPPFRHGDQVRVLTRTPVGHYRVPTYLRGKRGVVESIIEPAAVDNEEEGFGRNAGNRLHYYRIAFPMQEIWVGYAGSPRDALYIEIYETWLERI